MARWSHILWLGGALMVPQLCLGEEDDDAAAAHLVRALGYDHGGRVTHRIMVVSGRGASSSDRGAIEGAVGASTLSAPAIDEVQFASVGALLKAVDAFDADYIFVDQSMAQSLSAVLQVSRARKVPTIAISCKLVERGASLGATVAEGDTTICVNRKAMQSESLELDAQLLRIATFVGG